MKKPLAELFEKDLETVGDIIEALMQMPKGYMLHPLGKKCVMGASHIHQSVFLDEPDWLPEYIDEIMEEAKKMGEPTEIEVPDEKLAVYQTELHVVMGYVDLCENGNYEAVLQGVFSTEQLARECGDELVASGNIHHYEIECPLLDEFGWR